MGAVVGFSEGFPTGAFEGFFVFVVVAASANAKNAIKREINVDLKNIFNNCLYWDT